MIRVQSTIRIQLNREAQRTNRPGYQSPNRRNLCCFFMARDRLPRSPEIGLDRRSSSPSLHYSISFYRIGNGLYPYAAIYGLLALGFDFLAHFVGLVSLGGAFFIGVGGYTAALLNKSLGLHP